jgi:hypothetical protein
MARVLLTCVALCALLASLPAGAQPQLAERMRAAAGALMASLDPGRRQALVREFGDDQRTEWAYVPRRRPGLSFADVSPVQRDAVHRLLRTALSATGHRKVLNIIELELVLREIELTGFFRDPEKYSIVFFGAPDAKQPWGWRFEGHHLSLSFTLHGDQVATTPSFFGANPAEVRSGAKKGQRTLAAEEDEARTLLGMLDERQRREAIVDARSYGEIVTRAAPQVAPLEGRGLAVAAMTAPQRAQLRKLLEVYAGNFEPAIREARLARALEGIDAMRFAWAGPTERGRPHYYRLQGPRVLVEYDSSQDGGNHVHTVWRDFSGDFGRDLLREHHARFRH